MWRRENDITTAILFGKSRTYFISDEDAIRYNVVDGKIIVAITYENLFLRMHGKPNQT